MLPYRPTVLPPALPVVYVSPRCQPQHVTEKRQLTVLDFRSIWENDAIPYEEFVESVEKNESLWKGVYRMAHIPDWAYEMACRLGPGVKLLGIVEDWCGDASNTIPVLARLGHEADCLDMKVIRRDEHPDVMDRYLTNGSRSVPIVIALDQQFNELGHWGPRPSEIQQWVMENKDKVPAQERYPTVRRWYAKDKGVATLREVLGMLGAQ